MVGKPSHIELGAPDPARAKAFFSSLFGWTFHDTGNGAWIDMSGVRGGLHRDEPWVQVFFSVPDLDDAAKRIVALGGEVGEGSSEGPEGKYLHSCRDDQGVPFGLHQPRSQSA